MKTINNVDMDISENPIQKPISSNKINWCLVGEYKNKRKCIDVQDMINVCQDKFFQI